MPRLYFKFGAMGSSKTAQALMCRYNYQQQGFRVLMMKPSVDCRDKDSNGKIIVRSRIGLSSPCVVFQKDDNLYEYIKNNSWLNSNDVVIIDECQFCTKEQIEQLKEATYFIPVLCYGLKTNFKTELFEGSKRLLEIADSIAEIKSVCKCGQKATINARFINGEVTLDGDEVVIEGDVKYRGMCYNCFTEAIRNPLKKPKL